MTTCKFFIYVCKDYIILFLKKLSLFFLEIIKNKKLFIGLFIVINELFL